eukprot:scaffold18144_cov130-Isochrysis_galbana.AAC.10
MEHGVSRQAIRPGHRCESVCRLCADDADGGNVLFVGRPMHAEESARRTGRRWRGHWLLACRSHAIVQIKS